MAYSVKAKLRPHQKAALLEEIDKGRLGHGSVYLENILRGD